MFFQNRENEREMEGQEQMVKRKSNDKRLFSDKCDSLTKCAHWEEKWASQNCTYNTHTQNPRLN